MNKLILALAAVMGAFALTACQSTSNSPTPATAAQTCTLNAQGISVNQNGNLCTTSTNTCGAQSGLTFNPYTQQWVNSAGVPVACSTGGVPIGGGGGGGSCTYWSSVYPGTTYIPMVDPTTGNLVCINVSSYGINTNTLAGYGYTNYSQPVYTSVCPYNQYNDPNWMQDCGGGWNYNGGGGSGSGVCIAVGAGDGSDYGYGDGFFGICM